MKPISATSFGVCLALAGGLAAQEPAATPPSFDPVTYEAPRTNQPVVIDARLDEPAWQDARRIELIYEVRPGENVKPPVDTTAYVTYDDDNVYFGFDARDPDPKAIRANLTDRDQSFRDDFVGVILDTFNDERRGFEFFVNPLGVQMDLTVDDLTNGDSEDASWDAIWSSAGRITAEGYVVEMAIPFSSLRFQKGGAGQTWGFMPYRAYPRAARHQIFDAPRNRNRSCWLCQASKLAGFVGVEPGRSLELTPTLTAGRNDARDDFPGGALESGDAETDLGLTASWGVTPNINLSGTINPDFSQVEADSAQLDINNTFALFFPERRPFFLEGADFFTTPISTVFTRNVANPSWGAKAVGKSGRNAFGVFVAQDDVTQVLLPGTFSSDATSLDEKSVDSVLRYRRDIGAGSAVGLILTDREGGGYSNRVGGFDGLLRINEQSTFRFQALGSQTEYPDEVQSEFDQPDGRFADQAFYLGYSYNSRSYSGYLRYEDIGDEFRADLGFLPQIGRRSALVGGTRNWYGKEGSPWTRFSIGGDVNYDRTQGDITLEEEWELFLEAEGPYQTFFFLGPGLRDRYWNGVTYRENYVGFFVNARPAGWLSFNLDGRIGDQIDFANDRLGDLVALVPGVQLSVGKHLRFELDHNYRRLDIDAGTVFTANLSQVRAIYQFNIRSFVRAIVQYTDIERDPGLWVEAVDARSKDLFTQLLFSYKVNPRTVLFLGYSDGRRGDQDIDLTQDTRSVFLKLGYAWAV
jgi:hypothetical protein